MAEKYFEKFPAVQYGNSYALDITERVAIVPSEVQIPYAYYKYDISFGQRADQISDSYYNDQYMDWLLYLSNGVIDPYYDWYMTNDKFNDFLIKKYGTSISNLQDKVYTYRNNWYNGDDISVSGYSALPNTHHRYWQPIYNNNTGEIVRYTRTQADWSINTNSLVEVECVGNNFVNNEIVNLRFDVSHSGTGQVTFANSSTIRIQHVSGTLYANDTVTITGSSYVYGRESFTNVAFTATTSIANNIPSSEEVYWDSISIYDYENEKNESKKTIQVLDNGLSLTVSKQITDLLAQ